MISESIVRLATPRDEVDLMAMCHELHNENGLFRMDDAKVISFVRRAFARNGALIGVIGPENKIEGAIFLLVGEFWYSADKHLEEIFSYVRPEFRRSKHAQSLIRWATELSDVTPLPLLIGILSTTRTVAKVRLYRRQLGDPIGAFFFHNKNAASGPAAADQPVNCFSDK